MSNPKITVKRKGHTRRAYLRGDGTRVEAAQIGPSTFRIKDRGERGKTPKGERWFDPQVETGWEKTQNEGTRRAGVLRAHGGDKLSSARAMQALANVTTDRETRKKAASDARYFFFKHRLSTRIPRQHRSVRITPRQPKLR